MAEYTYKQWGDEKTEENNIHADDCYRWQAGIEAAGGTWDGEWVDLDKTGKGLITADQLNALEQEIADLYGSGFTAKTFEGSNIPGTAEWNRIEDAINYLYEHRTIASGECGAEGDNVIWKYLATGEFILSGTGATADYTTTTTPAYAYLSQITKITIENGITYVGNYFFYNARTATEIEWSNTLETIGVWCFTNCIYVAETTLPDSLTTLANGMFYGCTRLQKIVLGAGVTTIQQSVFYNNTALTAIIFTGAAPTSISSNSYTGVTATAYYPEDKSGWDSFNKGSYGGTLTWVPYNSADGIPDIEVTASPQSVEESDEVAAPEAEEIE